VRRIVATLALLCIVRRGDWSASHGAVRPLHIIIIIITIGSRSAAAAAGWRRCLDGRVCVLAGRAGQQAGQCSAALLSWTRHAARVLLVRQSVALPRKRTYVEHSLQNVALSCSALQRFSFNSAIHDVAILESRYLVMTQNGSLNRNGRLPFWISSTKFLTAGPST